MASAARGLEDQLGERGITLRRSIAPDAAALTCDARRMRQALYNPLSNAVGFSRDGQEIDVAVTRDGAATSSASPTMAGGIPTPSGTGSSSASRATPPAPAIAGWPGLAIVRSFVALHGGDVSIESTPGEGTVVTCRIPTSRTGRRRRPPDAATRRRPHA